MIAVSLKDGEQLVDLLLRKEADVNAKSKFFKSKIANILIHPQISATRSVSPSSTPTEANVYVRADSTTLHSIKK